MLDSLLCIISMLKMYEYYGTWTHGHISSHSSVVLSHHPSRTFLRRLWRLCDWWQRGSGRTPANLVGVVTVRQVYMSAIVTILCITVSDKCPQRLALNMFCSGVQNRPPSRLALEFLWSMKNPTLNLLHGHRDIINHFGSYRTGIEFTEACDFMIRSPKTISSI